MQKKIFYIILLALFGNVSFAQLPDTTDVKIITWQLACNSAIKPFKLDTNITLFDIYNPIERASISSSYLGNIGLAAKPNVFTDNTYFQNNEAVFFNNYLPYFVQSKDIVYYNVNKPFSLIRYSSSSKRKDEQYISFVHTQNVNEKLNWGFNYNRVGAKGNFPKQQTRNNAVATWLSYISDHYNLHANFCFNKFKIEENGGYIDTGAITLTNVDVTPINLSTAKSVVYHRTFFVNQEYKIGKSKLVQISDTSTKEIFVPQQIFSYTFSYIKDYRIYIEENPETEFYSKIYYDSLQTRDSSSFRSFVNTVQWKYLENSKFKNNLYTSISYEANRFYTFKRYILNVNTTQQTNFYISAGLYSFSGKKWNWNFDGRYYLSGYKTGDFVIDANVRKIFRNNSDSSYIELKGHYQKQRPVFFENQFYSNHLRWDTTFSYKTNGFANLFYYIPRIDFSIGVQGSYMVNHIYYDTMALANQYKGKIYVFSAYVHKDLTIGVFHLFNKIVYQKSSQPDIFQMPELVLFNSSYIDVWLFKKALRAQVGYNLWYSTKFKAYSYMPVTGQFYLANRKTAGNYPIVDVFANLRVKSVLIFFKFEHLNSLLSDKFYFSVNQYPTNYLFFKFGVLWKFND